MERDLVFELKQKFLQKVPHPTLIQSAINRLDKNAVAKSTIVLKSKGSSLYLLEEYIEKLLELKLKISQSTTSEELLPHLQLLKTMHIELIQHLAGFYSHFAIHPRWEAQVKQSETVDAYEVLSFCRDRFANDNEIKEYLRELNSEEENLLLTQIVRSKKILDQLLKNE